MTDDSHAPARRSGIFREEFSLWVGLASTVILMTVGAPWVKNVESPLLYGLLFAWVFGAMLWLAFGVVKHADCLAVKLGEPYGTLILTLSVISIEVVMITAVMLTGGENPALARDTMFSVLMIVLNGMLGVTLLAGGWKHREQTYNLQGANAYLAVIIPLAGLGLVLPRFTDSAPGGVPSRPMEVFLAVASIVLYAIFLLMQSGRHRNFFQQPVETDTPGGHDDHGDLIIRSTAFHAVFLFLCMLPIVLLSKKMAYLVDHGMSALHAPQALGGFLVAILVLSPEGLGAFRAAVANRLQRTVNIALGSALATIGLTIPAVLIVSLVTGKTLELGLEPTEIVLLGLSIGVCVVNFASTRTNLIQGAVHLVLFLAYLVLIFD
ncbi:calcium:proton antiporter [Ruficoccus amylovorans]|uniref:Calcium:proton antiporter n=1 Tax=Ruficoccus amylovorans TaxID=1804625 RepID=A0A842HE72_9BACT|nr:calcium:proton antiporter [Ruficoccus amylovorans]MBC2594520.1 calcium:proton antiporter [Ruficoccus amylovorans]